LELPTEKVLATADHIQPWKNLLPLKLKDWRTRKNLTPKK
jgi:hypothetical protein